MKTKRIVCFVVLLAVLSSFDAQFSTGLAAPMGTAFTYQGRLEDGGAPANGRYDLQFLVYNAEVGGSQIGPPVTTNGVAVSNGLFTVALDFGAGIFGGDARWLGIYVRTNNGAVLNLLSPRQSLAPAPYALYSPSAATASLAESVAVGGVTSAALADNVITSAKILDGAVSTADLAGGAVTGNKIALSAIGMTHLTDAAVASAKIADSAITSVKLADNSVSSAKIIDGSVSSTDLGLGVVTTTRLADDSVTAAKLASDAGSLSKVTAGSVTMNGVRPQLNSNDLLLKTDDKHGLGYYGNTKYFGGVGVDGPVLYGYSGGGLGSITFVATNLAMVWKNTGNVGIGVTNPATRLDIFGTNSIASGMDGIVNVGDSAAAHLTLDANEVQARSGASDTMLLLNRVGGSVAVGISSASAKLDVNGDTRVRGVLRTGAENTGEAPSPAGLVVRRINSTSGGAGNILAKARTQGNTADITLERDGTPGGFLIRYPANPGYVTIACMGMDNTGTVRNFYSTLADPVTEGTVQIYANALNLAHFQCTFGITYNPGQHLTQVTLSRFKSASVNDDYWFGTVTSTYNQ